MPVEDITDNLPGEAQDAGLELVWRSIASENQETVILLNRDHHALYVWTYVPSIIEAREKSMELLKEGRIYD